MTMTKRRGTLKEFVSCFVMLSKFENLELGLGDFLVKYLEYLEEKRDSEKFILNKIDYLYGTLDNLDRFNAVPKKSCRVCMKRILFLKLKIIDSVFVKEKSAVEKLSTFPKIVKSGVGEAEKKILEYVNSQGKVRNRDILSRFGDMHPRTIKRNLNKLVEKGHVEKISEGQAVFYSKK